MKISSETAHILAGLGDHECQDLRDDEWDIENADSRACSPLPKDYIYSFFSPEGGLRRIAIVMSNYTIHCEPLEESVRET